VARLAAVTAGGAVGTAARIGVGEVLGPQAFPWATLTVNVVGSALLGFLVVRLLHHAGTAGVAFAAVGALGAFTTFSAFVAEADALGGATATVYVAVSLLAGLAAARLGMRAAR
jgi:CrcB protein